MSAPDVGRIAVLGAGAVGTHLGALLSGGGLDVTLIGRPRVLQPMREGVVVENPDGSRTTSCPAIATSAVALEPFDLVLLTVKAYSVAGILDELDQILSPRGRIVAFQNGVGSDEALLRRFGLDRVVAATSTISVGIEEPGMVTQYTNGGLAWSSFGSVDIDIGSVLELSGLPVIAIESPASVRWSKLLLNAVGAAQCAILGINFDAVVADGRLFRAERLAFLERLHATARSGIEVVDLPGFQVRLASRLISLPSGLARLLLGRRMASARGGKPPTLRTDVERGGPTENEYLNGATVRLGRSCDVSTPVNATFGRLVDEVTMSADARARFLGRPEKLIAELNGAGVQV